MNAKAKKLINELNELWQKNGGKWSKEYEDRLYGLTEDETELLSSSYFESEDAVLHWSNVKSLY